MTFFEENMTRTNGAPEAVAGMDRRFGGLMVGVFALLAAWPWLTSGEEPRLWSAGIALLFLLLTLSRSRLLRRLLHLWLHLGQFLQRLTTPLLMAILFFAVVTPIALLLRGMGRHPLQRLWQPDLPSYWQVRTPPGPTPESMREPF
ncbi:MAG: SxtJ family membrane protein [Magnetococcus sp. YQC-3]